MSYLLLKPYVKGYIEDAAYYFRDMDRRKSFELDHLLITQGWSSYEWKDIFNKPPKNFYAFETGIGMKANVNGEKSKQFFINIPSQNQNELITVEDNSTYIIKTGMFPEDGENIEIAEITTNGKLIPANVSLQISPSEIPRQNITSNVLATKINSFDEVFEIKPFSKQDLKNVEELDEVLIKVNKKETKAEMLQRKTLGKVEVFDDIARRNNRTLAQYLSKKGYATNVYKGQLSIRTRNPSSPNNSQPILFLDDVQLMDFSFLAYFDMTTVDYIEINSSGIGEGMNASAGVIKINTIKDFTSVPNDRKKYNSFNIPLTFTKNKTFYVPKYNDYNSDLFEDYGVIGWFPNMSLDKKNSIDLKVFDPNIESFKLVVEGFSNEGHFISEELDVNIGLGN